MNQLIKVVMIFFLSLALLFTAGAGAQSFQLVTVALDHPANGHVLRVGNSLAVSGHSSSERWLSLIDLEDFTATPLAIPEHAQVFSTITRAGQHQEELVFLTTKGLSVYDAATKTIKSLVSTSSIYPVVDPKRLRHLEMTLDINDSGLSDFLVPDFTAYHLFVQSSDESFVGYRLEITPEVQMWGIEPQFMPRKPYILDFDLDGRRDVIFLRDGQLVVFYQRANGSFGSQPAIINPGMKISPDVEAIIRSGEGRDFAGLVIHRVHDFQDLDGDGLGDLVIRQEKFSSAVEQDYSYRIHYGRRRDNGLGFALEPDAHISTRGIQFEPVFIDIDGDGRKDFYTPSTTFGVGSIIRALLSGTANLDMQFYLMKSDRTFNSRPDHNHKAVANVSVGRGAIDMPLLQVAKTGETAHKDLLIGEGQERLRFISGGDKKVFAGSGARFNTPLPRDGSRVKVMDINKDGKEDLVLPFDSQDSEETRNQVRFLIMQ